MRVFLNIQMLELNFNDDRGANVREVFDHVEGLFIESASIEDAYLCGDGTGETDCVFGAESPDAVIAEARLWNDRIRKEYADAYLAMPSPEEVLSHFPLDSTVTYRMKKAAMALDNDFYTFAEYATAMEPEQGYLKCIIQENELADVIKHPDLYAFIDVYPK